MMNNQEIIAHLERKGVRATVNRILIFSELQDIGRAVSLKDLEERMLNLDKSSIFRVLTLFEQQDVVHAFEDGRGIVHYELCRHEGEDHHSHGHLHFYCERCQQTYCLEDAEVPEVRLPEGFVPHSVSFVLKGICPKCGKTVNN